MIGFLCTYRLSASAIYHEIRNLVLHRVYYLYPALLRMPQLPVGFKPTSTSCCGRSIPWVLPLSYGTVYVFKVHWLAPENLGLSYLVGSRQLRESLCVSPSIIGSQVFSLFSPCLYSVSVPAQASNLDQSFFAGVFSQGPSISYIPRYFKAWGWRLAAHDYFGAVALYITQIEQGQQALSRFDVLVFTLVTAAWVFWDHSRICTRNENLISSIQFLLDRTTLARAAIICVITLTHRVSEHLEHTQEYMRKSCRSSPCLLLRGI